MDLDPRLSRADWFVVDEVDLFEDRLAQLLDIGRPTGLSDTEWRQERVRLIEACDQDRADELAAVVTEELRDLAASDLPA